MTPIMVRPVREQFEHDRVIRLLQSRFRRRYAVAANIGDESTASVRVGTRVMYPDLTLTSTEGGRRLHGVVEVETTESINHLEARAQWAHLGTVRGAFYLYVPAGAAEMARRLCADNQVAVTEIWSYHAVGDQMRFTMAHRPTRPPTRSVRPGPAKKTISCGTAIENCCRPVEEARETTQVSGRRAPIAALAEAEVATPCRPDTSQWPVRVICDVDSGARRPAGQARRGSISGIYDRGATPPDGMPRPEDVLQMTRTGH